MRINRLEYQFNIPKKKSKKKGLFKRILKAITGFLSRKGIDALSLGAAMAVVPLLGDLVWWYRDYLLGEWTWHLAFILCMFSISTIGSIIAMLWYHRTRNDLKKELLKEIRKLKKQVGVK